jgi:hypothetical protein
MHLLVIPKQKILLLTENLYIYSVGHRKQHVDASPKKKLVISGEE